MGGLFSKRSLGLVNVFNKISFIFIKANKHVDLYVGVNNLIDLSLPKRFWVILESMFDFQKKKPEPYCCEIK